MGDGLSTSCMVFGFEVDLDEFISDKSCCVSFLGCLLFMFDPTGPTSQFIVYSISECFVFHGIRTALDTVVHSDSSFAFTTGNLFVSLSHVTDVGSLAVIVFITVSLAMCE